MAILPEFVVVILRAYAALVFDWVSAQIYTELLKRADDHFLIPLTTTLDFTPLETACAGFHHASGPGASPTHPVPRLIRALLIGALFGWSLRQLEFQLRFHLLIKWFVGYPVFAAGPDHSTLERFEQWVIAEQHRTLFDEVLRHAFGGSRLPRRTHADPDRRYLCAAGECGQRIAGQSGAPHGAPDAGDAR